MNKEVDPNTASREVDDRRKALIRPAFSSNLALNLFLILLVFTLVLPRIISQTGLITRVDSYDLMPEDFGEYSFIKNEIFNEKDDIDVLFIGTSITWNAIDTPLIQKALSEKLGRPARVLTFGYYFSGVDISYAMLRDLLERRRVRLIIYSVARDEFSEGPSLPACKFVRYDDHPELTGQLPLSSRISMYGCSVIRSPHELLTMVRENQLEPSPFSKDFGSSKLERALNRDPFKPGDPDAFVRFTPRVPEFSSDELLYSRVNRDQFHFRNEKLPDHHDFYLDALFQLLETKKVPLAMMNIPQYFERNSDRVIENQDWTKRFGKGLPLIGVPAKTLFAGINEKDLDKLYADIDHFSANGNEYYSQAILPAILEVYESHATKEF